MGGATRNRFAAGRADICELFKWFREVFEEGHNGARCPLDLALSAAAVLLAHALSPVKHEYPFALSLACLRAPTWAMTPTQR